MSICPKIWKSSTPETQFKSISKFGGGGGGGVRLLWFSALQYNYYATNLSKKKIHSHNKDYSHNWLSIAAITLVPCKHSARAPGAFVAACCEPDCPLAAHPASRRSHAQWNAAASSLTEVSRIWQRIPVSVCVCACVCVWFCGTHNMSV